MSYCALIIDGDTDGRTLAATVLKDALPGIRVTEVVDAITLADALGQPAPEMAVVARELGWIDGLELIKLLHRRHPDCATILLGAMPADQTDPEAQPDAHLSRSIAGLARLGPVALRAVEKRSRARHTAAWAGALNDVPVAIIELTTDECVLSANARAIALFEYDDERSLVGRPLAELVSISAAEMEKRDGGSIASTAAAVREGISVLTRPGAGTAKECHLMVRADTRDGVLRGFTAALIPRAMAPGGRTNDLLYAVSHDLQQPLATTGRSAQMLAERLHAMGRLDSQEDRMLRRIISGTERMETLMKGLLDYVKTGQTPVAREPVNLGVVCEEVVRNMHPQLEEAGGMVRWKELPSIHVNHSEILRLLENLIGNAIKFRGSEKPVVDIECTDREGSWLLSIRDNGIGIKPVDAERIFQPFQRLHTESEYPGTGIGLAICRQICERHGGRLWVTANPEGGSTFFATIDKGE